MTEMITALPQGTGENGMKMNVDLEWDNHALSVRWPGRDAFALPDDTIPNTTELLARVADAESQQLDGAIVSSRRALGAQLFGLLDGAGRELDQALHHSTQSGQPFELTIRLLADDLAKHPAAAWRWELLANDNHHLVLGANARIAVQLGEQHSREPRVLEDGGLQILFMAYSPQNAAPELDYEREEERVIEALEGPILDDRARVQVVEDGTLAELERRLKLDAYSVVHLSGHGILTESGPRLLFEDEFGDRHDISPTELLRAFKHGRRMPDLVMISSCHSADARGDTGSFAAQLVAGGVPSVVGWVRPVRDDVATEAATVLYERLCMGEPPVQAIAKVIERLHERDEGHPAPSHAWGTAHLVTREGAGFRIDTTRPPLDEPGYSESELYRFLGEEGRMRVLERGFVGRRRPLQRLVRILRHGRDRDASVAGAYIVGMKGVGKSCLAGRAISRHRQELGDAVGLVVLHGQLDEARVLGAFQRLAQERGDAKAETLLGGTDDVPLRLQRLLRGPWRRHQLVIVLDDFEQNLEPRDDGPARANRFAAALLKVLLPIARAHRPKLLITTTMSFELPPSEQNALAEIRLGSFDEGSIRKLWYRGQVSEELRGLTPSSWKELAQKLGANARLLEWTRTFMAGKTADRVRELSQGLESRLAPAKGQAPTEAERDELVRLFLRDMAYDEVVARISEDARTFVKRARVYETSVPRAALEGMADGLELDLDRDLTVLQNAGLLEAGMFDSEPGYRVSVLVEPKFDADEPRRWHEVEAEFWAATHDARPAMAFAYLAWEHGLEGRSREIADRMGRRIDLSLFRQGLTQRNKHLAERHVAALPESGEGLLWLGSACERAGDPRTGWQHYEHGEQLLGPVDRARRAAVLQEGADILRQIGRLRDAQLRLEAAIDGLSVDNEGEAGPLSASLHSLAGVLKAQGDLDGARSRIERSLQIKLELYGTEQHPGVSDSLHDLAGVLQAQGDLDGARSRIERSLQIQLELYGTEQHPHIATTIGAIASLDAKEKRFEDAIVGFERCLAIRDRVFGTRDHYMSAETEVSLAAVLMMVDRATEAREYFNHAIDVLKSHAPGHRILARFSAAQSMPSPNELAQAALEARRDRGELTHALAERLDALAAAGSPLDRVAAFLRLVATGDNGLEIADDLPDNVAGFMRSVRDAALGTAGESQGQESRDLSALAEAIAALRRGNTQSRQTVDGITTALRAAGSPHERVAEYIEAVAGGRPVRNVPADLPNDAALFIGALVQAIEAAERDTPPEAGEAHA